MTFDETAVFFSLILQTFFVNSSRQPGAGIPPIPLYGDRRDLEHRGDLVEGQAGEKTELHDRCLAGLDRFQLRQRLIDFEKLSRWLDLGDRS